MIVHCQFFAGLRQLLPSEPAPYPAEVEDGLTVAALLEQLGAAGGVVRIILVNGRHADPEHRLHDGDRLSVFPPVAGG